MNKPMPFLDILYETRSSLCGKRHDRVFGLMGLMLDGLELVAEPSYEVELSDLSTSMTQRYIERHSLDIILLAHHHKLRSMLPSWSPDYFRFDRYPPDRRIWDLSMSHRSHDNPDTSLWSPITDKTWSATGNAPTTVLFAGAALRSSARRIGSICSIGRAWSDPDGNEFPKHDTTWARTCSRVDITKIMYDAILKHKWEYNKPPNWKDKLIPNLDTISQVYYYCTHTFLESHGICDFENLENKFTGCICANRKFFAGGRFLQDHAKQLDHPVFYCGLAFLV
jgi:hypothetical protein